MFADKYVIEIGSQKSAHCMEYNLPTENSTVISLVLVEKTLQILTGMRLAALGDFARRAFGD